MGSTPTPGPTFAPEALPAMRRTCNARILGSTPGRGSTLTLTTMGFAIGLFLGAAGVLVIEHLSAIVGWVKAVVSLFQKKE